MEKRTEDLLLEKYYIRIKRDIIYSSRNEYPIYRIEFYDEDVSFGEPVCVMYMDEKEPSYKQVVFELNMFLKSNRDLIESLKDKKE